MNESEAELDRLQELLDASLAKATEHLRSIIKPGERTLTARQLVTVITGMCTLSIATVTSAGEPRVSGIDGHFLNGAWVLGTGRGSAKARHLAVRPAVSVAHMRGEELGVFTHGHVEELNPQTGEADPHWPSILDYLRRHYDSDPLSWGDVVYYRLRPSWMVVFAADPTKLLAAGSQR
jgi:Pyridoxamine 5'-phosphate oxidase